MHAVHGSRKLPAEFNDVTDIMRCYVYEIYCGKVLYVQMNSTRQVRSVVMRTAARTLFDLSGAT